MNVSYLYTPALRLDSLVANRESIAANVVVVDLEDSVHFSAKAEARDKIARFDFSPLTSAGVRLGLRINTICTFDGLRDMEAFRELAQRDACPFEFVFIPKINHQSELRVYRSLFATLKNPPKLYTFIESLEAVENANGIAAASDALCLGQADLSAEMYNPSASYLDYARARLCTAAARHRIQAIDTNSFEIHDMAVFERDCLVAKEAGFTGKAAIHPNQVEGINRLFSISEKAVADYRSTIDTYDNSGIGFALKDGKVLAPPFVAKARLMLSCYDKWEKE
jgi:citrate lyase subunit beta/citryl-CoA lyase/(S)-citramalyl-CoA lyase